MVDRSDLDAGDGPSSHCGGSRPAGRAVPTASSLPLRRRHPVGARVAAPLVVLRARRRRVNERLVPWDSVPGPGWSRAPVRQVSPASNEGVLARRRSRLVSADALAGVARSDRTGRRAPASAKGEATGGRTKTSIPGRYHGGVISAVYLSTEGCRPPAPSCSVCSTAHRRRVVSGDVTSDHKSRLPGDGRRRFGVCPATIPRTAPSTRRSSVPWSAWPGSRGRRGPHQEGGQTGRSRETTPSPGASGTTEPRPRADGHDADRGRRTTRCLNCPKLGCCAATWAGGRQKIQGGRRPLNRPPQGADQEGSPPRWPGPRSPADRRGGAARPRHRGHAPARVEPGRAGRGAPSGTTWRPERAWSSALGPRPAAPGRP